MHPQLIFISCHRIALFKTGQIFLYHKFILEHNANVSRQIYGKVKYPLSLHVSKCKNNTRGQNNQVHSIKIVANICLCLLWNGMLYSSNFKKYALLIGCGSKCSSTSSGAVIIIWTVEPLMTTIILLQQEICRNRIKAGFFNVIIQYIAVHGTND